MDNPWNERWILVFIWINVGLIWNTRTFTGLVAISWDVACLHHETLHMPLVA